MEVQQNNNEISGRFQFAYRGVGLDLALLLLKNFFLTIMTLGIYHAWARTNMRRYLWENIEFMGDRGTYTGTGAELFKGWLKLIGLIFVTVAVTKALGVLIPKAKLFFGFLVPVVYIFVFALATYSGLRYRLSRTMWRQIRFGVDKDETSTKEFMKIYFGGLLLTALTLGLYYPYYRNNIRTFLTNRARFGSSYFQYDGDSKELFWIYIKGFLLTLITFGIYGAWFMMDLFKFRLKHTHFQNAKFEIDYSGTDLFLNWLGVYFGTLLTMGLAAPWLMSWFLRNIASHVYLVGSVDLSLVKQQAADGSALADDIVAEYDLDLGF